MKRWMTRILLVQVFVFVPLIALAQMESGSAEKEGMMGDGIMGGDGIGMQEMMGMHGMGMDMSGGMMDMMKMMKAASRLALTPDQKKKFGRLKLQHQKEAIPLVSRVRITEVELQELLSADSVNLEKVKAKIREKHDALAELELSHLALTQQVKSILTPEQRQRLESMLMDMGPGMMMGRPKTEKSPKAAPDRPGEASPKTEDPHGH